MVEPEYCHADHKGGRGVAHVYLLPDTFEVSPSLTRLFLPRAFGGAATGLLFGLMRRAN